MKVLLWNDCDRFCYPDSITSLEEFIAYAETRRDKLIPLVMLRTDNCVHPYYIEEDKKLFYVNVSAVVSISEDDVEVLQRCEYERRLTEVISTFCVNCTGYEEDSAIDDLKGHRNKLCLDGSCWAYEKKQEQPDD